MSMSTSGKRSPRLIALRKRNNGSPGVDGVSFSDIEARGLNGFLKEIQQELEGHTYRPSRVRKQWIPKANGKFRELSIPTIKDRVVQGALKLILEAVFEADFQSGSYGYRPKRTAQAAVTKVAQAIVRGKTKVIDLDLMSYFDNVVHPIVLKKVAQRVNDEDILKLLKRVLKASGKKGVPQGGVISPLLSNLYLNEVDRMLEKAKEATQTNGYTNVEYVRFADDLVVLVDGHPRHQWLVEAIQKRLREEYRALGVAVNEEKSKVVDLTSSDSFTFLGYHFRQVRSRRGKWSALFAPELTKRTRLLQRLREIFRRFRSQPVHRVIERINPILRGWVNYFRIGHSARCFSYVRNWVEESARRHLMRNQKRRGFGWKRWTRERLNRYLGLYRDYGIRYLRSS
jgi:RNA-directed DNA polymerase